jgi:radical SAM superfamily enzyme YgiQ (UPF0313 family)
VKIIILGSLNYCPPENRYLPYVPLGPLSCAAVLEEKGWQVEVLDPNLLITSGLVEKKNLHLGLASLLCSREPDVLGFSTYSNSYHQSLQIAECVKSLDKQVVIVFGGPQASVLDTMTLRHFSPVDIVVRGEGERTFASLLERISHATDLAGLPGITHRSDGIIKREEDAPFIDNLDDLPLPAYHLYPMEAHGVVPLDVGRGCPFSCSFCSTCHFWKKRHRMKSPDRIVREIRHCISRFGRRIFEIPHDLFTFNRELIGKFTDLLRRENLGITWSCFGRIDCMDAALLKAMAESGCAAIGYGVESGSQEIQKAMGKNLDPSRIHGVIMDSLRAGLNVVSSYIIGFPQEREQDLKKTLAMMMETFLLGRGRVSLGCALLIPYAGSQIYQDHKKKLVYNGYRPARKTGSPYDRESILMIRRYPEIFSDHYHCALKFLKRAMLEELMELFVIPCTIVPASTVIIWEERRDDPFGLYREWKSYHDSLAPADRYRGSPFRGDSHRAFAVFFRNFVFHLVQSGLMPVSFLPGLIDYETSLFLLRTKGGSLPSGYHADLFRLVWDDEQFLRLHPVKESDHLVNSYHFDVKSFSTSLLAGGKIEEPHLEHCSFVLWQPFPGVADSLRIDEQSMALLDLCRGKRSVAEIVAASQGRSPTGGDEEEKVKGILRDWFRIGLIKFTAALQQ